LPVAILYHYILDKFPFSEVGCRGLNSKISFAHWTFLVLNTEEPCNAANKDWSIYSDMESHCIASLFWRHACSFLHQILSRTGYFFL